MSESRIPIRASLVDSHGTVLRIRSGALATKEFPAGTDDDTVESWARVMLRNAFPGDRLWFPEAQGWGWAWFAKTNTGSEPSTSGIVYFGGLDGGLGEGVARAMGWDDPTADFG